MRRALMGIAATILAVLMLAPSAYAAFGLKDLDLTFNEEGGSVAAQAGSHPFSLTT